MDWLAAKVRGMIHDGIVKIAKTTTKAIQVQVQVDDDYTDDEVPLLQMQGARFKPPPGAELVMLCINGDPNRPVGIVAVHRDTCPTDDLQDGEGGLYNASGQWMVFLSADEVLHLGAKVADDFVALAGKVDQAFADLKTYIDAHTHTHSMGPTGAPAAPYTTPGSVAATKTKAT